MFCGLCLVGVTRFELATPRPPDGYATRLRYTPNFCGCKISYLLYLCKKKINFCSFKFMNIVLILCFDNRRTFGLPLNQSKRSRFTEISLIYWGAVEREVVLRSKDI